MYQDSLNYLFEEIQSAPVEANLVDEDNKNTVSSKKEDKLLF